MTGPFWGLLGVLAGVARSRSLITVSRGPVSPNELHLSVEQSQYALLLGIGAFALGACLLAWSTATLWPRPQRAGS